MKTHFKLSSLLILIFSLLLFTTCGDSGSETATIKISLGMLPGKAAVGINQLRHAITLSGPTGVKTLSISGAGTASVSVVPGTWHISVEGYLGDELYSVGSANAEVKAGRSTEVPIQMTVVWSESGGIPSSPDANPLTGPGIIPGGPGVNITLSPTTVSVEQGQTGNFTATVSGDPDTSVTWTYSGPTANYFPSTSSNDCIVYIDTTETVGSKFTLTATSVADPTKSASAVITVTLSTASYTTTFGPISLGTLTAIPTERAETFSVNVGGFSNNADANNVKLSISGNGLSFTGNDTVGPAISGTKTFSVTATYDGTTAVSSGSAPITISVTNLLPNYLPPSPVTPSFTIHDGQAATATRQIPINSSNIADFNVYANDNTGRTRHYLLTTSVVLSGTNNWTPIGTDTSNFIGSFDGGNNTITGLNISSAAAYQGMFGYIARNGSNTTTGVVRNLGLIGVDITSSLSGDAYVGSIVGYLTATSVSVGIENCYATGTVTGAGNYLGGLVGWSSYRTIQYCYFNGSVKGSTTNPSPPGSSSVGGIVGYVSNASLLNCYYSPRAGIGTDIVEGYRYVGGAVGTLFSESLARNCYSTGIVTGTGSDVGGLIGRCQATGSSAAPLENCYSTCTVTAGSDYAGGIIGGNHNNQGTLRNFVALNKSIILLSTNTSIARIYSGTSDPVAGARSYYARDDMEFTVGGASPYTAPSGTHNSRNGADVTVTVTSITNLIDLWADVSGTNWYDNPSYPKWDFTTVWWPATNPNNLPRLRNMPGIGDAQTPTLP